MVRAGDAASVCALRSRHFGVVLTRPKGQSAGLSEALAKWPEHAIRTVEFPLIDICPANDMSALDAMLREVARFRLVFFVSPNAIDQAFARSREIGIDLARMLQRAPVDRQDSVTAGPIVAVVGPGSVGALMAQGVHSRTHCVLAPAGALAAADAAEETQQSCSSAQAIRYDSESLLAALTASGWREGLSGTQALVVRGDGGREFFADALRKDGCQVQTVSAYQRRMPSPEKAAWRVIDQWLEMRPHVWVLSSSEAIRNLDALASEHFGGRDNARFAALLRAPVIVPHFRIADAARQMGFATITNSGAGDANILRAVLAASELKAHDKA